SPLVKEATIHLENGKTITINTVNQSKKNVYVEKVEVNGKLINSYLLKYNDIKNGGTITFYLKSSPNK
ncbi:glycoside hydrolase domain-containing protein, partial [Lutibacter sp.]